MNPTNITQILWSNLIAVSGADTLASLISSTIKEQTNSDIQDMLAVIVSSELEGEKLQRIIEVLEAAYVDGTEVDLAPFLAVLLHNAGTDYLARYYAGLSLTIPEYLSEKMEWVSEIKVRNVDIVLHVKFKIIILPESMYIMVNKNSIPFIPSQVKSARMRL